MEAEICYGKTLTLNEKNFSCLISAKNQNNYIFITKEKFLGNFTKILKFEEIKDLVIQIEKIPKQNYENYYLILQVNLVCLVKIETENQKLEVIAKHPILISKQKFKFLSTCLRVLKISERSANGNNKGQTEFEKIAKLFLLSNGKISLFFILKEPDGNIHFRIKREYDFIQEITWFGFFETKYFICKDKHNKFFLAYYDNKSSNNPERFRPEGFSSIICSSLYSQEGKKLMVESFENSIMY